MKARNKWMTLLALSLTACTGPAPQGAHAALTAGAKARSFGVASYEIDGGSVTLHDRTGALLGVLTVEDTSDKSRTVRIARSDGSSYENEVTGEALPFDDAVVEADREGTVQADAALVAFFANHQLAFTLSGQVGPGGAPTTATQHPDWFPDCSGITFAAGCNKWWQCSLAGQNLTFVDTYCGAGGPGEDCDGVCGGFFGLTGSSYYYGDLNCYACDCYRGTMSMSDYADCNPVSCSTRDVVMKTRTCSTSTSTCSNVANGFQYCL